MDMYVRCSNLGMSPRGVVTPPLYRATQEGAEFLRTVTFDIEKEQLGPCLAKNMLDAGVVVLDRGDELIVAASHAIRESGEVRPHRPLP